MVLAEMLTGDSLLDATVVAGGGAAGDLPARLSGMVLNEGLAIGTAVPHRRGIVITQVVAEDPEAELHRLDGALRSEEHTSELQSLMRISYAVFCLKKKKET